MAVTDCPIIGYYDKQRFTQFNPSDSCNWYLVPNDLGKKKVAMYPTMGRHHVKYLNQNVLIFDQEPRSIYKSINYWYAIVRDKIIRVDATYNQVEITASVKLNTSNGNIFFTYLTIVSGSGNSTSSVTFACFADGDNFYLYREETGEFGIVSDPHLPNNPIYLASFGNRIVCSTLNSASFGLSEINLAYNPSFSIMLTNCFTINRDAIFAQETGIINQMGVLQNTLYIFCDYTTGIWSNTPSSFISAGGTTTQFPFKKNTTYDFDFGLADPNSLDIDFGMMAWLARNRSGLIQSMVCVEGQKPQKISTKAIDVLLQQKVNNDLPDPFAMLNSDGFLYEYEDTIFYRLSAGVYNDSQILDDNNNQISIEFNFDSKTWHRISELNGERNRIQDHIFFGNRHLVTVQGDNTVYEMSGRFYTNDITNPLNLDRSDPNYYIQEPFRYERVTPIIWSGNLDVMKNEPSYSEFLTDYVEIDFIWGVESFNYSTAGFANAIYVVDENLDAFGNPIYVTTDEDTNKFVVSEQGNFPVLSDPIYNTWYKPSIELLYSDDGGMSFISADIREFSQLGVYQWRMRWYQLGTSRNRVYKLICVSPAPIVILGANMDVRRSSGGAA